MGNGKYEGYRNWTDQEGEDLEYGSEEYFDDFEEVLYFIDGKYAKITDLDEYIGSELAEGLAQELQGIDNAVVDCEVAKVVTHSEDEKPLDCKMEEDPLDKVLVEEETNLEDIN
jgi:hypothetical protein